MRLTVYLNHYGVRREVGLLSEENNRIFFEYSPEFIETGIELSPFKLPLKPGVFEETKRTFDGLFGLFEIILNAGELREILFLSLFSYHIISQDMDLLLIELLHRDRKRLLACRHMNERFITVHDLPGSLGCRHHDRIAAVDHRCLAFFHAFVDDMHQIHI